MATRIYAGTSAFFANRPGKHCFLDNVARPFLSVTHTDDAGKRTYENLFISKDATVKHVKKTNMVTITFPADTNRPLFSILTK
jgi:hypothetical protein